MLTFFKNIFHKIVDLGHIIKDLPPIDFIIYTCKRIGNSQDYKHLISFLNRWALLFHVFLSIAICFSMEWLSRHSYTKAVLFTQEHTKAFLYNCFVIFVIYLVVFAFKKRLVLRIFISAFFISLGYINSVILANRVTPFGFTDLYMVSDLLTMKNTSYFTRNQAMLLLFVVFIFIIFLVVLAFKCPKIESKIKLPIRIAIITIAFISLPITTKTLQQHNIIASYFGNIAQGYADYGFLYGFNMSIFSRGMEKPLLYSEETIASLISDTDMGASTLNAENGPNVIVMLLESFYDVSETNFIRTNTDPIPFFRSLKDNYSSGYLTVPVVGAGTCNSEFEVLTGMSCEFFGPGEYPQKTILKEVESCESIADVMKDIGYSTHVVHNNGGNFYSRKNAFSMMGFDSFTSKEMLDITEYTPLGSWPTDDILIDATKKTLDSTDEKDFVYTITVQTHGDYPKYKVLSNPQIDVSCIGKTEQETYAWEYYINMLHREDEFLKKYIKMLEERNEPTIVIMFGDHLPTMGLMDSEQNTGNLFITNYATWNNFDMPKQDKDLTTYQLVSEYLNRLGIHGGSLVNYNQYMTSKDTNPKSFSYLNGIHMLQYDLLYGKRYSYENMNAYSASDIKMGVENVRIDRMYAFNDTLHIFGQNFTPWSTVYVDNEPVNTTYRSGQLLTISLSHLGEVNPIQVNQMGSNNTIFRSSNKAWYYE